MVIRKTIFYLILLLCISFLTSCAPPARYADSFYNINDDDYPLLNLPMIKPIKATRQDGRSPWRVFVSYGLWVKIPEGNKQNNLFYAYSIEELETFAVQNGVIMA